MRYDDDMPVIYEFVEPIMRQWQHERATRELVHIGIHDACVHLDACGSDSFNRYDEAHRERIADGIAYAVILGQREGIVRGTSGSTIV